MNFNIIKQKNNNFILDNKFIEKIEYIYNDNELYIDDNTMKESFVIIYNHLPYYLHLKEIIFKKDNSKEINYLFGDFIITINDYTSKRTFITYSYNFSNYHFYEGLSVYE